MVVTGLIRPPPEIRAVADRTALYVAKNGRAFETKILNSAKGQTPRFAFLHGTSPFHAYYEDRIQFYENGGTDEKEKENKDESSSSPEEAKSDTLPSAQDQLQQQVQQANKKAAMSAMIDPIAKALLTQRTRITEIRAAQKQNPEAPNIVDQPPPLPLLQMVAPHSLTIVQLEVMQAVAQFTALSSSSNLNIPLLQQLSMREWNNPAFASCHPRHGHFAYFSALVDAYKAVLQTWNQTESDTNHNDVDPVHKWKNNVNECLQSCAYRAEYERDQEIRRQTAEDDHNLVARIDWHEFVVVETIEFAPDEVVAMLPPPPPPPPPPVVVPGETVAASASTATKDEMDESDDDEDDDDNTETIRVVPSYTPKVVAAGAAHAMEMVIDPITGQSVAVKDMPEHMRIQLLDPKWAEERRKFQLKQKESNLVSGDVVASNLERLTRGDRFGKKEQDLLSQEAESKRRLDEANRIIREQAAQSVGPLLPRKEPPTAGTAVEPSAKRPKITYAPEVLAAQHIQQQQQQYAGTTTGGSTTAPEGGAEAAPLLNPPPPPTEEELLAAAATGALPISTLSPTTTGPQELIPEEEFAASHPVVTLQIRIPNDPAQMAWNFYGQIVTISAKALDSIKQIKATLSSKHLNDMPVNKIQLRDPSAGTFLKDAASLAAINLGPTATMEMVPRSRGGKKK